MAFRGLRLGAFLVPLAVAAVPVGVLLWYGLVHIPAHENYLNERNLRLLMTLSGNMKIKIDNYDSAIDHAVESFGVAGGAEKLRDGVHLFAPELDILQVTTKAPAKPSGEADIERLMLADASDPPRIRIDRDEGRAYLYFGARLEIARGETAWLVAKTDIDAVVAPFLTARREFDALLLVTQTGEVIAQRSPIGLGLARVDTVLAARGASFDSVRHFSNMIPVRIGEVDYKMYLQPVSLSLLGPEARHTDQWVLCGLVRADRYRAESSSLSFSTLLWFSAALAAVFLAIPYVKLRALRPRERLRASDAGWVAAATFAGVGLIAIGLLDAAVFGRAFPRAIDSRLAHVADTIAAHVDEELQRIDQQGQVFDADLGSVFRAVSSDLSRRESRRPLLTVVERDDRSAISCDPIRSCRTEMLEDLGVHGDRWPYPFVYLVTWIGSDGSQRIKWTPGAAITPFLNVRDEKLPYYADLQRAWLLQPRDDAPARGVSVLASPNTGEPLTVFWRARGATADELATSSQSLATFIPIAFDGPILPRGVSFAVIDGDGRAIFHADRARSLQENFLKEAEDNAPLRAVVAGRQRGALSAYYLGRLTRLFVTPLTTGKFANGQWSLVVFQDSTTADTINLETVTIACLLFGLYGAALALVALVSGGLAPRGWTKWFWPAGSSGHLYSRAAMVNGGIGLIAVAAAAVLPAGAWLVVTVVLAAIAAIATRRLLARRSAQPAQAAFGLVHPFFMARAAFLVVMAALPAIACFQTAYAFETKLLATAERTQYQRDDVARSERIDRYVARFSLRDTDAIQAFAARRRGVEWDRDWTDPPGSAAHAMLDPLLASMHRSYNDVAIELSAATAAADLAPGMTSPVTIGWLTLLAIAMSGVCYAFVYVLVKPMFVLQAAASAAPRADHVDSAPYVLIIGPPGSGKSTKLGEHPGIRVFDVTKLGYVERRKQQIPVPVERRYQGAPAPVVGRGNWSGLSPFETAPDVPSPPTPANIGAWADAFDYSTLPQGDAGAFGIDHLDHRLEERDFAVQTLRFLEQVVHRGIGYIRLVCDRDPLVCLQESGAPPADLERWTRALSSFRKEYVRIGRGPSAESYDDTYSPFYEALWHSCTRDERLTLRQLADEGLVNPQNLTVVRQLMRVGLIVRDPVPRVMSDSFRRFIVHADSAEDVSAWERQGVSVPWGSVEAAMMTLVIGLAALLVVTQEQLVGAWIGFVPTLLPAIQKLWTVFAAVPKGSAGEARV